MFENIYSMLQARWHYLCATTHSDFHYQLLCFLLLVALVLVEVNFFFFIYVKIISFKFIKVLKYDFQDKAI